VLGIEIPLDDEKLDSLAEELESLSEDYLPLCLLF